MIIEIMIIIITVIIVNRIIIIKFTVITESMIISEVLRLYWWVAVLVQWELRPIAISWLVRFCLPYYFPPKKWSPCRSDFVHQTCVSFVSQTAAAFSNFLRASSLWAPWHGCTLHLRQRHPLPLPRPHWLLLPSAPWICCFWGEWTPIRIKIKSILKEGNDTPPFGS